MILLHSPTVPCICILRIYIYIFFLYYCDNKFYKLYRKYLTKLSIKLKDTNMVMSVK